MATTTYGTSYATSADLVSAWPAASLLVANSVDAAGYYIGRGINDQTASYVGILTDAGKTVTMTVATSNTFTIPPNSSVAYPTGTRINVLNLGAGACTVTAGAGVTIAGTVSALAINGFASLVKTATNTWSYMPPGGFPASGTATVDTLQSTTSTSFTDLATVGPSVTITTGTKALVSISSRLVHSSSGAAAAMGFAVSGATTVAADIANALITNNQMRATQTKLITGLTAGSNVFTAKYESQDPGTSSFQYRQLSVIDMGS